MHESGRPLPSFFYLAIRPRLCDHIISHFAEKSARKEPCTVHIHRTFISTLFLISSVPPLKALLLKHACNDPIGNGLLSSYHPRCLQRHRMSSRLKLLCRSIRQYQCFTKSRVLLCQSPHSFSHHSFFHHSIIRLTFLPPFSFFTA